MSVTGIKNIFGVSVADLDEGINVVSMKGPAGMSPTDFTVFIVGHYPEGEPASIQMFPGGRIGTDDGGEGIIGVTTFFTLMTIDDEEVYGMSWDGTTFIPGGLWSGDIRASFAGPSSATFDITLQFYALDPSDPAEFPELLDELVNNPQILEYSFDAETEQGEVVITFEYENELLENPDGFVIKRAHTAGPVGSCSGDGATVCEPGDPESTMIAGTVLWVDGTTSYSFHDSVFATGDYTYWIIVYRYSPVGALSPDSPPTYISFDPEPSGVFTITGSGGVDFGGSPTIVYIEDASGIYTLINRKTNDSLYNRIEDDILDVKIPDPFVRTGFIGG